jgi:hypothetical protein
MHRFHTPTRKSLLAASIDSFFEIIVVVMRSWSCWWREVKPGVSPLTCVTRNSWERKPRGVKTTESEFSDPIPLPHQILYSYT